MKGEFDGNAWGAEILGKFSEREQKKSPPA
jgi:hypothetical protein